MTLITHEDYFATAAPDVRALLEAIQAEVERLVPGAERCIAYKMPAYRTGAKGGRVFFYFAAFRKHIGIFPPIHDPALVAELAPWRGPKGNLSFPLKEPLPIPLIGRVAAALADQYGK